MEQIIEIPLSELHDSPFNPRKTFLDIEDLAADIRSQGRVLQPLLVRPNRPNPLRDDLVDGYEIVFGHRRKRGALAAGLERVHCMVREMTTAEAQRAQISENLQRKDVHPIEEAEGFQVLMLTQDVTADQLAAQFGKSRSYVYGRLKLLQACGAVRSACVRGEIGSEVALLVARLGSESLQRKALARIQGKNWKLEDGGKESFRRIRDLLAEEFTLGLDKAIFDPEDDTLLPDAGKCSACPRRLGNAPEYADLLKSDLQKGSYGYTYGRAAASTDTCTDPECFASKKDAHLRRDASKLAATGAVVVGGNAARQALSAEGFVKGAYVAADKVKAELKKLKGAAPKPVLIQDQRTGKTVKAFKRADLQQAGMAITEKASQLDLNEQRNEEAKKKQAEATRKTRDNIALLKRVRTVMATRPRTEHDLRAAAAAALRGVEYYHQPVIHELWGVESRTALEQRMATMTVAEVTQLLMDCALVADVVVNVYSSKDGPKALLAAAAQYGVDPDAPADELSTPSTAARAPEEAGPAGGESKAARAPADAAAVGNEVEGEEPAEPAQEQTDDGAAGAGQHAGDLVDAMLASTPADEEVKDDAGAVGADDQHADVDFYLRPEEVALLHRLAAGRLAWSVIDAESIDREGRGLVALECADMVALFPGQPAEYLAISDTGRAWLAANAEVTP